MSATGRRADDRRRAPPGAGPFPARLVRARNGLPLSLAAVLLLAAAALLAVGLRGPAPARTPTNRAHAIAAGLRCPVCRDLSVADSPAPLAQQMRATIARDLAAGKTAAQIRAEFVAAYGDSVLLAPPRHGLGLVAWVTPILLLAGGLLAALLAVRRWRAGPPAPPGPGGQELAAGGSRLSAADRRLLGRALAQLDEDDAP
jgi:cytochrome c-type biogenesis protein CcmH